MMSITSVDRGAVSPAPSAPAKPGPGFPTVAEKPLSSLPDGSGLTAAGSPLESIRSAVNAGNALSVSDFLNRIIDSHLLSWSQLEQFLNSRPERTASSAQELVRVLIAEGLLTEFQVARILAGQTFGLVLGNYRIVERIGAGGMGTVYKAEHIHMKRAVAIKVLVSEEDEQSIHLQRFFSEMQATAVLSHANIVLAFDAGEIAVPSSANQVLRYLVMEYVPGRNLEQHV